MKKTLRKTIAGLMVCIILLGLTACNTSSSVSRKAKAEDIEKFISDVANLEQFHIELNAEYSDESLTESERNDLSDALRPGTEFYLDGSGKILSLDVDRNKKLVSGTLLMDGDEYSFLDTENTSYLKIDNLYLDSFTEEIGVDTSILKPYVEDFSYLDFDLDNMNTLEFVDVESLIGLILDTYSDFDMRYESSKSSETGREVIISIACDDVSFSKSTGEKFTGDSLNITLKDVNDGEEYVVILLVSSDIGGLKLEYSYKPANVNLSEPSDSEILTESKFEEIINQVFADFVNDEIDYGNEPALDDPINDATDGPDEDSNNTEGNTPTTTGDSTTLSDGTVITLDPDNTGESYANYTSTFKTKESELSSKYEVLGEFDYVSDFRRKFSNTYGQVASTLKSTLGFEESKYGLNESGESTIYVTLENTELDQEFSIIAYIWGNTSIGFDQTIDKDEMPTFEELNTVSDNINIYTGVDISSTILQDLIDVCEDRRIAHDKESYYSITVRDETNDIDIEVTRFTFATEFKVSRGYSV